MRVWQHWTALRFLWVGAALVACEAKPSAQQEPKAETPAPPSANPSAAPPAKALSDEEIKKTLNPLGEAPYAGPTATVAGVVKVSGDPPPVLDEVLKHIEAKCEGAKRMYGTLFREGPGRTLGDALVAVTEYKGFVPAEQDVHTVRARDCAFETRTVALTFGQTLQVKNSGGDAVIPELLGTKTHALVVAMPGGDAVTLFPPRLGNFVLKDNVRDYAIADVFVVRYATLDVTGLDGRFEIPRVPAGKVRVSAYLPITGQTVQQEVQLKDGEKTDLVFEIEFDASKHAPNAPE